MKNKLVLICTLLAFTLSLSACSSNDNYLSIKTAPAQSGAIEATIDVAGILAPADTVNVSSKIGGRVENVGIEVGTVVKAGDVLVTLDKKDIEAQVRQAELAYETAVNTVAQNKINMDAAASTLASTKKTIPEQETQSDIALKTAEQNVSTAEKGVENANKSIANAELSLETAATRLSNVTILYKSGAASKADMDTAQTQYNSAVNQLEVAKNQLEISNNQYQIATNAYEAAKSQKSLATGATADSQLSAAQSRYDTAKATYETSQTTGIEQAQTVLNTAKLQLDNTTIVSPISGTVVNINTKPGEMISANTAIVTIADISTLNLKGTVSQESFAYVKKGDKLDVTVDIFPGKAYSGEVKSVGPIAVSSGNYFPIEINISNESGDITAGLSAHGKLSINSDASVIIPATAVIKNNGEAYVFVIKNNVAQKRTVVTGIQSDTQASIISGLSVGEIVAVSNTNNLFDNMTVKAEN